MLRLVPRGITGRLIIYLALIGVLPPLVVGMVSYQVSQGIVRQELQRHTEQLLQAQSDYLEAQVDQVEGLVGNILGVETITDIVGRRGGELDTYDQLATQARIGYLLNGYMDLRGLVSIDIFTSDGRHYHVGDTLDVHSINEVRRDALFAAVARDPTETLWAGAETNVNDKSRVRRVIATARAINAFDGSEQGSRVAGLLLVSQDVNYLYSAFRRLEGDMPSRLLLVDGKNRIVYQRDATTIGTPMPPAAMAALAGAHGTSQRSIAGVEMLVSEVTSPSTGWRLMSLVPLQDLDTRSSPIWRTTTLAIAACLLVIALAAISFSRAVVMPLRRIRQGFQEMQRGCAGSMQPLPVPGRDEVGDLTLWFNTFLESWGARERSEAALREAEMRFRMMHEASFTGLCVHHEGIILEANQALCREFGRDYDELIGAQLSELLAPDTPLETIDKLLCCDAHGLDVEAVRADRSRFPAELSSRPMPFRGKSAHVVDVRNIEARKRAEAELERLKNQAEVASRAKSQFLATMSHEIRTPMNAVLGLAYLLQSRALGPVEHDMVQKIRNAGRSLLGIINDILDFSKIEAGRLELEHEPFRLSEVLDNVATIMASSVGSKDIELIVGPVPKGAMFLRGDALRLEQILVNLVSNAIKFTETGEVAVTISAPDTRPGQIDLRFSVRDTGIGIPAEHQEEIFSAFSQAENSTTRRFGGTGLGLTITRQIVRLMGGSVDITSAPGMGSDFCFIVPLSLDEPAARPVPMSADLTPAISQDELRMLIADDHPVALTILTELACSMGYSAAGVCSGDEAVTSVMAACRAADPYDVVLLDCKMPGTSGLAAAAQLRAAVQQEQSPAIILVTGQNETELPGGLAGVVDAVLSKPVTASAMQSAVERARRKIAEFRGGGREKSVNEPHATRLAGLSILVVDDSDINREVAHQILESEGASVLLAVDGSQALTTLQAAPERVQIVLMDVQMPVMDGYEATRHIRETVGLADLPVVALTAGVLGDQQAATLDAGMDAFIAKPFDVERLVATILRLTGRKSAVQPATAATDKPATRVIDIAQGLRNWKDNAAFSNYLYRFAAAHGDDGTVIGQLLTQDKHKDASAVLHKLKGAAGAMALVTVSKRAENLEQAIGEGHDVSAPVQALQEALDAASTAIAAYAGVRQDAPETPAPSNEATTAQLLDALLRALDLDSPDEAEAVLYNLSSRIPAGRATELRERLEAFDFRGAEMIARSLVSCEQSLRLEAVCPCAAARYYVWTMNPTTSACCARSCESSILSSLGGVVPTLLLPQSSIGHRLSCWMWRCPILTATRFAVD